MINIVIPLGNISKFFDESDYQYPKPLIEVNGKIMIQHVIENLSSINEEKKFIFILREQDCFQYHLDNTIKLLTNNESIIIKIRSETRGAACSTLLAIDYINNDNPLIIANGDQIFDFSLNEYINNFQKNRIDAGCLCFDSVHPRWSYVRLENENIIETAEKKPISNKAIAGFYFFVNGRIFVEAAFNMIKKDVNYDSQFFISPVLNELILLNKKLMAFNIPSLSYHTFYSPQKIEEYEKIVRQ